MRMYPIEIIPFLCTQHKVGLHGELHKFLKSWEKKQGITGRIEGNQMQPLIYKQCHDEVAKYLNHKSPLSQPDFSYLPKEELNYVMDTQKVIEHLRNRCVRCTENINSTLTNDKI